jgi:signal peptidase I
MGRILIKRVIATGGQTVDLRDGRVYVDDVLQNEPYTHGEPSLALRSYLFEEITYPYTVPPGGLWVMGDNRTNSQDSRYFGAIPESSVTGKALFIYWPLTDIGLL